MRIAAASFSYAFSRTSCLKAASISFGVSVFLVLPACLASASIPVTISLMALCAVSSAVTMSGSVTSLAPASTMTMPSLVPATMRSSWLFFRSLKVGLMMKRRRQSRPTRTPAIVLLENGIRRERQRRRRTGNGQHVGVVFTVGREHESDDLRFVAPAAGKQRPDRAVDQTAGQDFLLGRLAFAFEEAAGDASRGVGVFLVVDAGRAAGSRCLRAGGPRRRR